MLMAYENLDREYVSSRVLYSDRALVYGMLWGFQAKYRAVYLFLPLLAQLFIRDADG